MIQLIQGVSIDLKNEVTIKNEKELITYSYFVAGTVGIMMAKILKANEIVAFKYAVDLGIAFQLTNIARDILEDVNMNRIYIPRSWMKLNRDQIKSPSDTDNVKLKKITRKIINMSEKYYRSALKGLAFLSFRNRFAILLALIIYRQIGIKIIRKNFSNIYKREKVNFFEKLFCILKCLIIFTFKIRIHKKDFKHDKSLHKYIKTFLLTKNKNVK